MIIKENRFKFYGPVLLMAIILGCIYPAYSQATSFSVDGTGDVYGQFPTIGYGLALNADKDILPVGAGGYGLFGFFDTGSTLVAINDSGSGLFGNDDAFYLGLAVQPSSTNVDVRINGLGATTQYGAPGTYGISQDITSGGAEADIQGIAAAPRNVNVTLIGAPVANQLTAVIDYTTQITRKLSLGTPAVDNDLIAPDIMFNPSETLMSEVELTLERFGSTDPSIDGATQGQRYYLRGVNFIEGMDGVSDADYRFLYDTGTNVTLIGESIAAALGLGTADFTGSVSGITRDGYFLDSIEMTGVGGTYTVLSGAVFVVPDDFFFGPVDAIIGANLFNQTSLLFDGPENILGIGVSSAAPVPEPATMFLLGTGLVGVAGAARRKKKNQA